MEAFGTLHLNERAAVEGRRYELEANLKSSCLLVWEFMFCDPIGNTLKLDLFVITELFIDGPNFTIYQLLRIVISYYPVL